MEEVRHAPDEEWCADTLIKLTRGVTAYRLDLPETSDDATQDHIPLVVCLHDICNASYMWKDLSHLLTHIKTGPPARVLVLDFYGNGRSPWCEGVTCTMDIFVFQVMELLCKLGISQEKYPFTIVGQGFGAAVAAGFAARNPHFVQSVVLMNPAGIRYNENFLLESTLRLPLLGRWLWQRSIVHKVEETVVAQYHDACPSAAHYKLVKKDIDMLKWQFNYTPGFVGALHSKLAHFPLCNDALFEMYSAMGMHPNRDMLVLVGDDDRVFGSNGGDSSSTIEGEGGEEGEGAEERRIEGGSGSSISSFADELKRCFRSRSSKVVALEGAGHSLAAERFKEVSGHVLTHCKEQAALIRHKQFGY